MYKALARAEIWHAGIQLCRRDDPEVIVMASVCVFLGTLGQLHPWSGLGEDREALEETFLSAKGPGLKEMTLVCRGFVFPGMELQLLQAQSYSFAMKLLP